MLMTYKKYKDYADISRCEVKMTKAEVVEFGGDRVIIHIQYTVKDEREKKLIDFPRVAVPITTCNICLRELPPAFTDLDSNYLALKMFSDEAKLFPDDNDIKFTESVIESYEKEMTLEEIEKALGHPVKIISERRE